MKLKFLNSLLAISLATPCLAVEYRWFGEAEGPLAAHNSSVELVDEGPGVKALKSLQYHGETEEKGMGKQHLLVTLNGFQRESSELTVACFILPERRDVNEDLLATKTDRKSDFDGFRLYKNWRVWGFQYGDGMALNSVTSAERITMNTWQHLAVVFKEGSVKLYQNGVLVGEKETNLGKVRVPGKLWVGSGLNRFLPFKGLITGVYVSDTASSEDEIYRLMQSMSEE